MSNPSKASRPLESKDVVKIIAGKCKGETGVVNRFFGNSVNIFLKGGSFGIWFGINEVKRIGRVK